MLRPRALLVWLLLLGISACKKPYRVGEYVLVDWEENRPFAAFITHHHWLSDWVVPASL